MARMNHEKLNLQKRIASEGTPQVPRQVLKRPSSKWLPMTFGKYEGLTLPQIFFRDVQYVEWLAKQNTTYCTIQLCQQLKTVSYRARNILPPTTCKKHSAFAIVLDSGGVFYGFAMAPRDSIGRLCAPSGCKIVAQMSVLDAMIPAKYRNPKLGFERMAKCLRHTFLPKGSNASAEKFMEQRRNFRHIS